MFELKITTYFAAAHQLAMVAEKCENLHGHNWKTEVYIQGETLNQAGVLIDFGLIKKWVKEVMNDLDHKFLNELEIFTENNPPSSENIAKYIAKTVQSKINNDNIKVCKVSAWESNNSCASYIT